MATHAASPPAAWIGTEQHVRWLQGIVKAVIVLNGIDAVLTLLWVYAGLATEANPMLDRLLEHQPVVFVCVKLGVVFGGSWLLWNRRNHPLAVVGLFTIFLVYYYVLLYHLEYAGILLRSLVP